MCELQYFTTTLYCTAPLGELVLFLYWYTILVHRDRVVIRDTRCYYNILRIADTLVINTFLSWLRNLVELIESGSVLKKFHHCNLTSGH